MCLGCAGKCARTKIVSRSRTNTCTWREKIMTELAGRDTGPCTLLSPGHIASIGAILMQLSEHHPGHSVVSTMLILRLCSFYVALSC
jgi:hypothetical protein